MASMSMERKSSLSMTMRILLPSTLQVVLVWSLMRFLLRMYFLRAAAWSSQLVSMVTQKPLLAMILGWLRLEGWWLARGKLSKFLSISSMASFVTPVTSSTLWLFSYFMFTYSCCSPVLPRSTRLRKGTWRTTRSTSSRCSCLSGSSLQKALNLTSRLRVMLATSSNSRKMLLMLRRSLMLLTSDCSADLEFALYSFILQCLLSTAQHCRLAQAIWYDTCVCLGNREWWVIQCIIMITLKSTSRSPNPNILVLEIDSESKPPKTNRFKSHKLKHLQSFDTSKHAKAARLLEKINFKDLLEEQFPTQPISLSPAPSPQHRSSYLAYKEEQRLSKAKHNKIGCVKTTSHYPISLDSKMKAKTPCRPSKTYELSRTRRKMSMVILGESLSEGNEEGTLNRSRNIYMKTSQGKRQRIDPATYMTRIKEKIQSLYESETNSNVILNNYLQHNYEQAAIKISPVSPERHVLPRNIRTRNFKKESPLLRVEDSVEECRPWTSRKSDPPQQ